VGLFNRGAKEILNEVNNGPLHIHSLSPEDIKAAIAYAADLARERIVPLKRATG